MSLAILDKLQSADLDPSTAFTDATEGLKESKTSVSESMGSVDTQSILNQVSDMSGKITKETSALGSARENASVVQSPFSAAELQGQLGAKMGSITALTPETLTSTIPTNPGAEKMKDSQELKETNSSVNDLLSSITGNSNPNPIELPVDHSSPFAEFQQFLSNAGALPSRVLDAVMKVIKKFLDKLSHPEELISNFSADALTDIFINQIKGLAQQLPSEAIGLISEQVKQQSILLNKYTNFLEKTNFDPKDLKRPELNQLRKDVNGWTSEIQSSTQSIQQAIDNMANFNIAMFQETLSNLAKANVNDTSAGLATLFTGIQKFVDDLKKRIGEVTEKLKGFIKNVSSLIDKAIEQVKEIAKTIVDTVSKKITSAETALEKVQNYLEDAIKKLNDFLKTACQKASETIVDPLKKACSTVSGIADQRISTVKKQIDDMTEPLKKGLAKIDSNLKSQLNQKTIEQKIKEILNKFLEFLQSESIKAAVKTATDSINQAVKGLEKVSLKPSFDVVISKTTTLEGKIKAIKVSELSTPKKIALKIGTKIIEEVDVPGLVTPELKTAFNSVVDPLERLVGSVNNEFNLISNKVEQFEPGKLAESWLKPYIDDMVTELKKYQPSVMLADLEKFYNNLVDQLEVLNPEQLVTLLESLYDRLSNAVDALNPENLIKFLRVQKGAVIQVLDDLSKTGVDKIVETVNSALGSAEKLLGGLGLDSLMSGGFWTTLQDILQQDLLKVPMEKINSLGTQIKGFVTLIDSNQDKLILDQLGDLKNKVTAYTDSQSISRINAAIVSIRTEINVYDNGPVKTLTTQWNTTNTTLERFSAQLKQASEPYPYEFEFNDLRQRISNLYKTLSAGLEMIAPQIKLNSSQKNQATENLTALATLQSQLKTTTILTNFKDAIPNEIESQLIAPIRNILTSLDTILKEPRKILDEIQNVIQKIQEAPSKIKNILQTTTNEMAEKLSTAIGLLKKSIVCFGLELTISTKSRISELKEYYSDKELEDQGYTVVDIASAPKLMDASLSFQFIHNAFKTITTAMKSLRPVMVLNTFSGASDFKAGDARGFIDRLNAHATTDPVSQYIWGKLEDSQKAILQTTNPGTIAMLSSVLNGLLSDPFFYLEIRFEAFKTGLSDEEAFSKKDKALLAKNSRHESLDELELIRFNRLLLEAAYESELTLSLQSIFPKLMEMLKGLYPTKMIKQLDDIHATIVNTLIGIPAAIQAAVTESYTQLLQYYNSTFKAPILMVFKALKVQLYLLQGQLNIGLDDVGDAFDHLLSVIPV